MTQNEKLLWLIKYLLAENPRYNGVEIPDCIDEQFNLYRSLVNVRMTKAISEEYLAVEDEFLQEETRKKGINHINELIPCSEDMYLWQGDITTIDADAIVNAANNQLLGCFCPCHACIDNCIHTFSGVRLRLKCNEIMQKQGCKEPTGNAKITPAYNLPSKYVIHTVGPIISGILTKRDKELLASCYTECLKLADENNLNSIAFCCISTGEFHFPNNKAAQIAIDTVKEYKEKTNSKIKVIFNVFKDKDYKIYRDLLCAD
ncbi:MAG: protein-ADP-ribose hydrolase [Clostridiales bacterium]|nr:protein-ADP-ribose hydrolase [Clostridiales bacterium]